MRCSLICSLLKKNCINAPSRSRWIPFCILLRVCRFTNIIIKWFSYTHLPNIQNIQQVLWAFLIIVGIWLYCLCSRLIIWSLTFLTQTAGTATAPLPLSLREPLSPSFWPQVRLHWSQVCFLLVAVGSLDYLLSAPSVVFMAGQENKSV